MHILIIPSERFVSEDKPLNGIFQYHQACALARIGMQVGVIAPSPRSLRFLRQKQFHSKSTIEIENTQGVSIYRYQGWNWVTGIVDWLHQWYWEQIAEFLYKRYINEHGKPDIIHAHNCLSAGLYAVRFLAKRGLPIVITEHSSFYGYHRLTRFQMRRTQQVLKSAHARLVVSEQLGHQLESLFGKVAVPWNFVPNILDPLFEQAELVHKDKDTSGFRFLNIALMNKIKNQACLLRAFANAYKDIPGFQLRIGGDGPLRGELESLAVSLGIEKQVNFLGLLERKQVLSEMQACDVFVFPSYYETFGVVLIEAAACGKPLIASSGSGPDCIVNNSNGVLVPPGDEIALANAMRRLSDNISQYDPFTIRNDCLSRFGEQLVTSRLKDVYGRVLTEFVNIKNYKKR